MARLTRQMTLKLWPNKDAEVEEVSLGPDDALTIIASWDAYVLVKDAAGRVFNLARESVETS